MRACTSPVPRRPSRRRSRAAGSPTSSAAARAVVRVRHRHADGPRDRARRGAEPRAAPGRLGRRGEGSDRGAADPRVRRREGAFHLPPGAAVRRPRHRLDHEDRRRRSGPDARGRPARGAGRQRRTGDRLREGRRGEHRLVRPVPRSPTRRGRRRLAAHRRRVRAVGGGEPAVRAPGRGRRAREQLVDRRAQAAERSVRLRSDALRSPRGPPARISVYADYLVHEEEGGARDQLDWTPEFSRRARGFTVYAAIRQLGRSGIAELVERCCDHATRFAAGIPSTGAEVC